MYARRTTRAGNLQHELLRGRVHLPTPLNNGWNLLLEPTKADPPVRTSSTQKAISALMQFNEASVVTKSNSSGHKHKHTQSHTRREHNDTSTEVWHQVKYAAPVVLVIALGEEIEAIYLLFGSGGPETDQPDVLMFKFSQGSWRLEE